MPAGWDLSGISCDDTDSGGDLGTATVTFNVEPGETVRCTFTNVQQGSIVISKSTEPSGGVGFGFSDDIVEPGSFVLDHAESMVFDNVSPGSYLVVEDDPSGLGYALTGLTCTDSDGGGLPSEIVLPTRSVAINLDPGETVSCSFTNEYAGAIKVEKATNGFDADLPPGPTLVVGDTVSWTYQVSNTGIETLTDILVTDDQVGVIDCPQTSLAPGETMLCAAQGVVMAGSYSNLAIASGLLFLEQVVTNADPSHYFGVTEQVLALEKLTNGEDADLAPGPVLAVGDPVTWSYQVSNTGSETLDQVTVSDDQGLAVVCPQTQLAPSESMTCTATGFAEPGQYANVGIASAQTPAGSQVLASDPSHYFGQVVQIEKTTNGEDADTAPGPVLPVGTPVQWIYTISNPGPEALTGILVSDDQGLAVDCPATDLAPRGIMICTASGIAEPGQYANVGSVSAQLPGGGSVVAADPSHYFGQVLQLEKTTNGIDADTAPGPFLEIGAPVTWEYLVTNLGSELLSNVSVVDDQGVAVSCPATTLDPGQTMTCSGQGTVEAGQYANLGSATALSPDETLLEAADPSHYFGQVLRIEKLTNGEDADIAPGPSLTVGAAVTWTYEISNLGSETLSNVSVSDDQGVLVDCPQTLLAAGESMTCSASGVVQAGQYANLGTVTATLPGGEIPPGGGEPTDGLSLSASDPSHYFGQPLVLEKATNGEDADVAPGPSVLVGSDISWTYQVTNLASVAVANVSVSDDQGVAVSCPADSLAPGASMTCTGSGTAVTGQYANLGQVTAELPDSTRVEASDPSHYFGENAAIDLEKFTNGENADAAPGPVIPAGDAVSWTYLVTNIGDVGLVEIAVSDDQGVAVSCPGTTLGVGEQMTCTGSGIAQSGQYANLGSVGALSEGDIPVADSDPSHYFGETGTIVIAKLTNPGGGSGFDFSEDIQGVGFSLNDGETTSFEQVAPGTYSVTELVPADWALTDLSCQDPSADSSVNGATATIVLGAGETVTCTFTNTALGSILIEKATAPEGGTGFDFASDIEDNGFSLDDGQVKSFSDLLPGSYSVTELVPAGWDLSGISCDDPSGDSGGDGATALIGLAAGETVRCTFSNAQRGGIVIEKTSDPAGGTGFEFSHDIDENGSFTLDDGGSLSFADLPAGLYTVTEAVPQGWVLLDLVCEDPSGGTERLGSAALIDLAPGEMVTCSFGNVAALIEITKTALSTPVTVGETAAFTIALRNSGLVTLSNLMVSDPLSPDCTRAAGELPDLAPGASTSYDCSSEPLFGDLQNQATVTADVPEGPPVSASASALVEVIAPQVEIDKQAAATQILAGEIAVFTISIHNPGDSPLIDVQVLDDLTPDCVTGTGQPARPGSRGDLELRLRHRPPWRGPGESRSGAGVQRCAGGGQRLRNRAGAGDSAPGADQNPKRAGDPGRGQRRLYADHQ